MRKLAAGICAGLLLVLVASFWSAGSASADGGVHVRGAGATTDSCAGCHRTHTAQADKLLKTTQTAICYTCHGATGTGAMTAVETGTGYAATTTTHLAGGAGGTFALRGGGFAFARIFTTDPSLPAAGGSSPTGAVIGTLTTAAAPTTSFHAITGTAAAVWGNGVNNSGAGKLTTGAQGNENVTCGSCHDPHGNGNFRSLRPIPNASGAAAGVNVVDEGTKNYAATDYLRPFAGLDPLVPTAGRSISAWCSTCHTRYLTGSSSSSGDTTFAFRHLSNGGSNPECTTCHAAHGSNASSAGANSGVFTWPDNVAGTPATNSRLLKMDNRGICQKCHNR